MQRFVSNASVMINAPVSVASTGGNGHDHVRPSDHVRKSAEWVLSVAEHVKIDSDAILQLAGHLAKQFSVGNVTAGHWKDHELRPKTADQAALDWIFLVNTLNFSFWAEKSSTSKFAIEFDGKQYTGSMSCWAAINRALKEGIPVFDANYLADITREQVEHLFRTSTSGEMPLLDDRRKNLAEAGNVLREKYSGTFKNCVLEAKGNAQKLLEIILENFPSFNDSNTYHEREVPFYKRAQVVVADIWACFEGRDLGYFPDIDSLTIFADYRIPQVLNYFGATVYSKELQEKLNANYRFSYGDAEEVEIRAGTVHVAELLKNDLDRLLQASAAPRTTPPQVNGILLDQYLWGYRQAHDKDMKHVPFHKVRSIYY